MFRLAVVEKLPVRRISTWFYERKTKDINIKMREFFCGRLLRNHVQKYI